MKVCKLGSTGILTICLLVISAASMVLAQPNACEPGYKVDIFATGFAGPTGLAFDDQGNLYVTNEGLPELSYPGTTVSKVTPDSVMTTFASGFAGCSGIAFNSIDGNLYVSDDRDKVYRVNPAGYFREFVTLPEGQPQNPNAIAFDSDWNLYVVAMGGAIYRVTPEGDISIFVDSNDIPDGFHGPEAIVFDDEGNMYTSDYSNRVLRITPEREVTVFATFPGGTAGGLAFDDDGSLYVSSQNESAVYRISPNGGEATPFATGFDPDTTTYGISARGLIFDSEGSLYIADWGSGIVWKVAVIPIDANLDLDPDLFEVRPVRHKAPQEPEDTFLSAFIGLPPATNVADVNVASVSLYLGDVILAAAEYPVVVDDVLNVLFRLDLANVGAILDLEVKKVEVVQNEVQVETATALSAPIDLIKLTVSGDFIDGRQFIGTDAVRVTEAGR